MNNYVDGETFIKFARAIDKDHPDKRYEHSQQIKSVEENVDNIYVFDETTQVCSYVPYSKIVKSEVPLPMVDIICIPGDEPETQSIDLMCGPNCLILTQNQDGCIWKSAEELNPGDILVSDFEYPLKVIQRSKVADAVGYSITADIVHTCYANKIVIHDSTELHAKIVR